jgi:hypothetical protein
MRAAPLANQAVIAIALIVSCFVAVATFFVKNVRERGKKTAKPTEYSAFHLGKIKLLLRQMVAGVINEAITALCARCLFCRATATRKH